ncbi:chorion peroxidase [Aplysia californica]|uniref:Chorion peroxidase n=1 Tax=Aplysia californica TaxID=6500 RepID=A0ABM0JQD0_APLCA|nr:chorion peroxidase [Aplysia californica]
MSVPVFAALLITLDTALAQVPLSWDTRPVCQASSPLLYFNLAETERAAATGSIKHTGKLFTQLFDTACPNYFFQKYRTIDGTCNNWRNQGAARTQARRLLPPAYDDVNQKPRQTAVSGKPLPSARAVSIAAHPPTPKELGLTNMIMQWGQFIDHDVTAFPVATELDSTIKCCGSNSSIPQLCKDENCFPILLPANDGDFRGTCMEFVRSVAARDPQGNILNPRQQINSVTSFIDGSQIYGSSEELLKKLRRPNSSRLKTKKTKLGLFLPEATDEAEGCILRENSNDYCFLAGDSRVNEHPALASMHTLWVREHNRIARKLAKLRPQDSTEEIFQLTRKIVGALLQKITYNDWLPIIIGRVATLAELVSKTGRSTPNLALDPSITNSFSTATFRFGHSMVPAEMLIGERTVYLRDLFNRPAEVLDNLDDVLAGLAGVSRIHGLVGYRSRLVEDVDKEVAEDLTKFLFQPPNAPRGSGFDLVSLNIQRGRDHGIPPYTKFREICNYPPLTGFNDKALGPHGSKLATIYESVDDIDLFTGLLYEPHIQGGIVGATLNCLIVHQFTYLKTGDRFFFDTSEKECGFTDDQLENIRETTLASIMCENLEMPQLPVNVFRLVSKYNLLTDCQQLKGALNLKLFQ